jgi:predicted HTH transcriptional regulator
LRWDLHQGIKSSAIEHASLKTVYAFLNSEGGDLMIGVKDDGSIQGIETDQFENNDRFLLHLWTLLRTCVGKEVGEWIKTSLQKFGNKTVCRVNCRKAGTPVFLRQKGSVSEPGTGILIENYVQEAITLNPEVTRELQIKLTDKYLNK